MANSNSNFLRARVVPNNMSGYQYIYGVGLLDDIHNYFPEFIYNQSRFQRPNDIFNYLNQNLRMFSGFAEAQEMYYRHRYSGQTCPHCNHSLYQENEQSQGHQQNTGIPRRRGISTRTINTTTNTQSNQRSTASAPAPAPASVPAPASTPASTPATAHNSQTQQQRARTLPIQRIPIITSQYLGYDNNNHNLLTNILNDPLLSIFPELSVLPLNISFSRDNLQPVIVRPTTEQIEAATNIHTIDTANNSGVCAVCLSGYEIGDEVRSINHCNHTYHKECIDRHFEGSVRCPLCRHDIREVPQNNTTG